MKLIFLGTGSAFVTANNYHSNMVLEMKNGKSLTVDLMQDILSMRKIFKAKILLRFISVTAMLIMMAG